MHLGAETTACRGGNDGGLSFHAIAGSLALHGNTDVSLQPNSANHRSFRIAARSGGYPLGRHPHAADRTRMRGAVDVGRPVEGAFGHGVLLMPKAPAGSIATMGPKHAEHDVRPVLMLEAMVVTEQ